MKLIRAKSVCLGAAALTVATLLTATDASASSGATHAASAPTAQASGGGAATVQKPLVKRAHNSGNKSGNKSGHKSGHKPKPKPKPHRWLPPKGSTFNNPLGPGPSRYRALNVVQNAILHAWKKSTIRIMSWNIMSRTVVSRLLNAQERGVRVIAIMDKSNETIVPNPSFHRLQNGLAANNKRLKIPHKRRSRAMVCVKSCRGQRGQAHAKFFLFSHTGGAKKVLMEGSSNLTAAAAINQWNDVLVLRSFKLYKFGRHVFDQMLRDKPVSRQYVSETSGDTELIFAPERGKNFQVDPRLALLRQVICHGAKGAGRAGRTVIRMTPDVLRGDIGMAVARQVRTLYQNGCDVRLGYTVMGRAIHRLLITPGRRGKLPLKHLVQDVNGDGEFDNYFHFKALTINGHLGKNPHAHVVINGSANVSGLAAGSDENMAIVRRTPLTLHYQGYIDYWWTHFPKSKPVVIPPVARELRGFRPVDPYAHVDMD